MNKILVAIVAVAIMASAQASTFSWKTTTTGKLYTAGTETLLASGTAYIFDAAVITQQALLTAVIGGSSIDSLTSLSSSSISNGAIAENVFTWGEAGDTLTAFIAVVDGDNVFISDIKSSGAQASATPAVNFNVKKVSQSAVINSAAFSTAGWYSTVPEPTSALLALLGFAGLALRRRRG